MTQQLYAHVTAVRVIQDCPFFPYGTNIVTKYDVHAIIINDSIIFNFMLHSYSYVTSNMHYCSPQVSSDNAGLNQSSRHACETSKVCLSLLHN